MIQEALDCATRLTTSSKKCRILLPRALLYRILRWRIYENSSQNPEISIDPQNQRHTILRKGLTLIMHLNRNLQISKIQQTLNSLTRLRTTQKKSPISTSTSSVSSNNIFTYGLDFESVQIMWWRQQRTSHEFQYSVIRAFSRRYTLPLVPRCKILCYREAKRKRGTRRSLTRFFKSTPSQPDQ